jgi:hypothetical protein
MTGRMTMAGAHPVARLEGREKIEYALMDEQTTGMPVTCQETEQV